MQGINQAALLGIYGVPEQAGQSSQTQKASDRFETALRNAIEEQSGGQESMDAIFEEAASTYGVPVSLLKAVAKAESNFNPSAVSKVGAIGVMQLMPGTASSLGVTDPFNARQNIMGGAKYLKTNLDRYGGNVSLALAAYNAGPGSVAKYGGVPPYAETQNYVKKVCSYMEGDPLYAGTTVNTGQSAGGYSSMLSALGSGYGNAGLMGLMSGSYGSSMGSLGSSLFGGMGTAAGLGSFYGTSDLGGGFGSLYGSSMQTGFGSIYGSSTDMMSLLFGKVLENSQSDQEDDKKNVYNLVELMRLQMMMDAGSEIGSITI